MTILELARNFREAVINIVSKEGQPGTLGTAGGTVFYNDGANDHYDRVWVRMGAENQVLVVANAPKAGLPNLPGLEVSVVKRHGSLYIDDWERNDAAAHSHEYATNNVVTGVTAGKLGISNVIMGDLAGATNPVGSIRNVIIGAESGRYMGAGGDYNVIMGYQTGQYIGTVSNVIIGAYAGDADSSIGAGNVIIGLHAGGGAAGVLTNNTMVGPYAGNNASGYSNTFIGENAGYNNTGASGVCLGTYAGYTNSADSRLFIGSGTTPLIYGEFDDDNVGINLKTMGGGSGVIAIGDAITVPVSNPTGGGILYVEAGALKYRGSSGTVTALAAA